MEVVQGYCTNHESPVSKISGPDGNVCLLCEGKKPGIGNTAPNAIDPGENKMRAMLAAAGVTLGPPKEVAPAVPKMIQTEPVVIVLQFSQCVEKALKIMESVPMPKDIKQFKAVNKIISDLKKLSGE